MEHQLSLVLSYLLAILAGFIVGIAFKVLKPKKNSGSSDQKIDKALNIISSMAGDIGFEKGYLEELYDLIKSNHKESIERIKSLEETIQKAVPLIVTSGEVAEVNHHVRVVETKASGEKVVDELNNAGVKTTGFRVHSTREEKRAVLDALDQSALEGDGLPPDAPPPEKRDARQVAIIWGRKDHASELMFYESASKVPDPRFITPHEEMPTHFIPRSTIDGMIKSGKHSDKYGIHKAEWADNTEEKKT